jgi:hypothetical protein
MPLTKRPVVARIVPVDDRVRRAVSARCNREGRGRRALIAAPLASIILGAACASEPAQQTTAAEAYLHYCSSCHGVGGKGDGPLAADLKRAPTDLTRLAARAGGFDDKDVIAAIVGSREVSEHGPREMPVWGVVFREELASEGRRYSGYTALLTARSLVDYLRALQEP